MAGNIEVVGELLMSIEHYADYYCENSGTGFNTYKGQAALARVESDINDMSAYWLSRNTTNGYDEVTGRRLAVEYLMSLGFTVIERSYGVFVPLNERI